MIARHLKLGTHVTRGLVLVLAAVSIPRTAFACAVCFGQSDSPMAWGVNMGVFLMLGVTGVVLASFAGFFIYLMRRAKRVADGERLAAAAAGRPASVRDGHYALPDAQEGTASC